MVLSWIGAFAVPANALLFLLRVNAVYHDFRLAKCGFIFLWSLVFILTSLTAPWGFEGLNIGPTQFCTVSGVAKFEAAVFVTMTMFDTAVFLSITVRVLSLSSATTLRSRVKAFTKGQGMSELTKALLQTGQLYYL